MNILFLTISNFNHIEEKGIYTDLLRQFRDHGHQVYIVCPTEKRLRKPTTYITANGVHVLKVKIGNITKNSMVEKGISTVLIESQFLKAINNHFKGIRFDVVIYSTPPITFEKVIRFMKIKHEAETYLLLKDIFPQNAVDLKMLRKGSIIHKYFRRKEQKLYEVSDIIGCMSQANIDYILKHNPNIPAKILEICPNSIEPIAIEKNEFDIIRIRQKYKLPLDKTIFIYGGNLGKPQGIPFLLQCLQANKQNRDAFFIIAGAGTEFHTVQDYIDTEQPANMRLYKELPVDAYEELVNACDVGLIFLDHRFTIPNFPSRLLTYMQVGLPVLAATDASTDIGQVIEQGEFGLSCNSNNVEQFNEKVVQLLDAKLRVQMGTNARAYLEQHYSVEHTYKTIINHFN